MTLAAGQSATGKDFGNFNTAPIPPTAQNDAATTPHDTPTSIDVLANDADDVALSPGALTVTTAPAHGTAAVDPATARVIYTPAAGFTGDDAFAYTVRDVEGATSAPATVAVTVTPTVGPPPRVIPLRRDDRRPAPRRRGGRHAGQGEAARDRHQPVRPADRRPDDGESGHVRRPRDGRR